MADFGISKLLTTVANRSQTHAGAGTPEYMAPEQIQGKAEPASDLYSLAMTAYQLLTGTLPFKGETPYDVLIKQMQAMPTSPRQLNPTIPLGVETALMQGLAKRPEERPRSCLALVEALEQAWNAPVLPSTDPEATILAPWSKRLRDQGLPLQPLAPMPPSPESVVPSYQPIASQQGAIQTGSNPSHLSSMSPAPSYSQNGITDSVHGVVQPTDLPVSSDPIAPTKGRTMGRRELMIGGAAAAFVVVAGGATAYTLLNAKRLPQQAAKRAPGPNKLIAGVPLLNLTGHARAVWKAVWDPSGRYLATGGDDNTVMVWDVGSYLQKNPTKAQTVAKPLHSWRLGSNIGSGNLSWSSDGRALAVTVSGEQNKIHVIDVFSSVSKMTDYLDINQANNVVAPYYTDVATSLTGDSLAVTTSDNQQVYVWQFQQPDKPIKILNNDKGPQSVNNIPISLQLPAWSFDGTQLAATTNNFNIVVWEIKTGKVKQMLTLPDRPIIPKSQKEIFTLRDTLQWSPVDSNMLMTANVDVASVWDVQHNIQRFQLGTDDPAPYIPPKDTGGFVWNPNIVGITWSPNGRYICGSFGRSHRLYMWDLLTKSPKMTKYNAQTQEFIFGDKNGHNDSVIDVEWSPDGRYLASASFDTTVIVWKVDGA